MEENIMLIVSDETYDRTATESVRPSSENRQTTARSGEMVESVIGRVWVKVLDIGTSMDGAAKIARRRSLCNLIVFIIMIDYCYSHAQP